MARMTSQEKRAGCSGRRAGGLVRFARRTLPLLLAMPVIQSIGRAKAAASPARRSLVLLFAVLLVACPKPEPLTKQKAEEIIHGHQFTREPVYAEVPQKVWWNARYP